MNVRPPRSSTNEPSGRRSNAWLHARLELGRGREVDLAADGDDDGLAGERGTDLAIELVAHRSRISRRGPPWGTDPTSCSRLGPEAVLREQQARRPPHELADVGVGIGAGRPADERGEPDALENLGDLPVAFRSALVPAIAVGEQRLQDGAEAVHVLRDIGFAATAGHAAARRSAPGWRSSSPSAR